MDYTELKYAVEARVATITLDRPERMNAWTPTMEAEFRAAMRAAADDEGVRAIVVTGAGRAFCAGADMGRLQNASAGGAPSAPPPSGDGDFEQRYSWLLAVPKPTIAAINGAVAGVGLCVTLYCDLRFMAAGARLSTSFARRGLIAEHGSAWMLPRLIGPMNAADLLLSGRTVDAAEAHALGLVRELPAEGFLAAVQARAAEFAALSSPRSMRIVKEQLRRAPVESLAQATRFADAETARCRETEDFREGVASFVEKRPPNFTGR
ncbi:MAG TPA: enoyl-CoA hydratase-related protein [Burkholderiaceae bacterium]|nr:enoyl-CoA hydratase-related protein [Burkholderiaceae bacterium]